MVNGMTCSLYRYLCNPLLVYSDMFRMLFRRPFFRQKKRRVATTTLHLNMMVCVVCVVMPKHNFVCDAVPERDVVWHIIFEQVSKFCCNCSMSFIVPMDLADLINQGFLLLKTD